jgi:Fe-S cluster assembly protein SufD
MTRALRKNVERVSDVDRFLAGARALPETGVAWLDALRTVGAERFAALGLPTPRLEDWKYTSVAPLARLELGSGDGHSHSADVAGMLPAAAIGGGRPLRLVFANGRFAPDLSARTGLPAGLTLVSLGSAARATPDRLRETLASIAKGEGDAFTALNTANLADGAVVDVAPGTQIDVPIELVFLTESLEPLLVHPRALVVAGERSRVTIVETHLGRGPAPYASNAVTEIAIGADATVTHLRIQREWEEAFHVATVAVRQARGSRFASTAVALGAALSRSALATSLEGEGASCSLDGLYLARGAQHMDHHTSIDHVASATRSRQLYKGVLADRATGIFNGKVIVREDVKGADAGQVNRNLLLSEHATVNTKPELQILADDVKCSHGATVGRLDESAIFYLRARGIGAEEARRLLLYAFASEIVDRLEIEGLRARLADEIWGRFGDPREGETPR